MAAPRLRAWRILDKAEFEQIVIPHHFRHARYASFMRQVSLALFARNAVLLSWTMNDQTVYNQHFRCNILLTRHLSLAQPQVSGWGLKRITDRPDHNAYFHEVRSFHPLPCCTATVISITFLWSAFHLRVLLNLLD